jgi:hypothetical protein
LRPSEMELRERFSITASIICVLIIFAATIWVAIRAIHVLPVVIVVAPFVGICISDYRHPLLRYCRNFDIRTLYSYRQWNLEPWLVEKLRDAVRLLRLTTRSPPTLPTELWEEILENAIHTPCMFDTTCHPSKFNLFINTQIFGNVPAYEYFLSKRRREELRLVCRLWDSILAPKHHRYIVRTRSTYRKIHSGARRLHFAHSSQDFDDSNLANILTQVPQEDNNTPSIPIVSIRFHTRTVSHLEQSFSILFDDPSTFGNLRSLIYDGYYFVATPFVLQGMQRSFRHLKVLMISSIEVLGVLRLDNIEVLYLNVQHLVTERWWFPSLRHVAFGPNSIRCGHAPLLHVPGPLANLQSLLLPMWHADIHADDEFWNNHSSLQFLGISCANFHIVSKPRFNHPLSYLYFTESESTVEDLRILQVKKLIEGIPNLQTVTLPVNKDLYKPMYPPDWRILYDSQRSRGIRWLRSNGDVIMPRRVRRDKSKRRWELVLAFVHLMGTMGILWYFVWGNRWLPHSWAVWFVSYLIVYCIWNVSRDSEWRLEE